jgi:hypothetical protein
VEVRWSKDIFFDRTRKDEGPTATLGIDVFNAFNRVNHFNYVGTLTSPFFASPVGAQPPRRVQLSVRTRF